MEYRLEKNDCEDIAFALSCLTSGVVTFAEFKEWLYLVIQTQDSVPAYFWEILDLEERLDFYPMRTLGYNPHWKHTVAESAAIDALGYLRSSGYSSDAVSKEFAMEALMENEHIASRFEAQFPFIDLGYFESKI